MCSFGIVQDVGEDATRAVVRPYLSDSCMGCANKCGTFGRPVEALNPRGLALKKNQTVRIRVSRLQFFVQGFFSLLFPILCAFAGFFAAPRIAAALFPSAAQNSPQTAAFLISLAAFAIAATLVFFLSRADFTMSRPEIDDVIL